MKLNIQERMALLSILPGQSDFASLKIIKDLADATGFSEEEHKEFKIVTDKQGGITWDFKLQNEKEIQIGEKATDIIVTSLKQLDGLKKLTQHHTSLYERFIEDKKGE